MVEDGYSHSQPTPELPPAIEAGAWGYLSKGDDPEGIVAGIRKVARGEFAMSAEVAGPRRRSRWTE